MTKSILLALACFACSQQILASDFCDGFKSGYETVYRNAVERSVTAPQCPVQPSKDFTGQSDFSQGYHLGARLGLKDGKAISQNNKACTKNCSNGMLRG